MPDRAVVLEMYSRWLHGETKVALERELLHANKSNGKLFTKLVKQEIGVDTQDVHPLVAENEMLTRKLLKWQLAVNTLREKYGKQDSLAANFARKLLDEVVKQATS